MRRVVISIFAALGLMGSVQAFAQDGLVKSQSVILTGGQTVELKNLPVGEEVTVIAHARLREGVPFDSAPTMHLLGSVTDGKRDFAASQRSDLKLPIIFRFSVEAGKSYALNYENNSPFDGITETWECVCDIYLNSAEAVQYEAIRALVDLVKDGDRYKYVINKSEAEAGIPAETYRKLVARVEAANRANNIMDVKEEENWQSWKSLRQGQCTSTL